MIINFTFETKFGLYSDSLQLDDEHSFSENEIEEMKLSRLDGWLNSIEQQNHRNSINVDLIDRSIVNIIVEKFLTEINKKIEELNTDEISQLDSIIKSKLLEIKNNNGGE